MRGRIRSQKSHLTFILKSLMFGDRQYLYLIQKISTQSCIRCFSFVIQKKTPDDIHRAFVSNKSKLFKSSSLFLLNV